MEPFSPSLCGPTADERGPGQRVISFSLSSRNWESEAVGKRVREMRDAYPDDYIIRIYHDNDWDRDPQQVYLYFILHKQSFLNIIFYFQMAELCQVYCENQQHVDLCAVQHLSTSLTGVSLHHKHSALWKFALMADHLVDEFHIRDFGTTVTAEREWAAVEEWLGSNREGAWPNQYD